MPTILLSPSCLHSPHHNLKKALQNYFLGVYVNVYSYIYYCIYVLSLCSMKELQTVILFATLCCIPTNHLVDHPVVTLVPDVVIGLISNGAMIVDTKYYLHNCWDISDWIKLVELQDVRLIVTSRSHSASMGKILTEAALTG